MSAMVRPKECQIYNPNAGGHENKDNGYIQLVMSNYGAVPSVYEQVTKYEMKQDTMVAVSQSGAAHNPQGDQGQKKKKIVVSNPMSYNDVREAMSLYGAQDSSRYLAQFDDSADPALRNDISAIEINESQNKANVMDAATRKRLRIERIKKKAAKNMTNSLDDPSQPEWVKIKNLREVA